MHLVFTLMRDESYRRRLRSVLCGVFRALINSLVCCYFCTPTTTFTDNVVLRVRNPMTYVCMLRVNMMLITVVWVLTSLQLCPQVSGRYNQEYCGVFLYVNTLHSIVLCIFKASSR